MFKELFTINFQIIESLEFKKKWVTETNLKEYIKNSKEIIGLFNNFDDYLNIIPEYDKKILLQDWNEFNTILNQLEAWKIKDYDNRLNYEKYSKKYILFLKWNLERFKNIKDLIISIENKSEVEYNKIQKKLNKLLENIEKLNISKNEISSEKLHLENEVNNKNTEIENLKLEIQKKELNKLAEAFDKEETKYTEWNKKWIIFWFFLLSIPSLFSIYLVLSEFIDNQYFNIFKITDFTIYQIIPFIILTLILWYFQYFQLKNYYINRDLATNFSNRKAIANSFKWLLELVNEEWNSLWNNKTELITKFIDKVWDVLYSNIDTSYMKKHNEDVPVSKLLDTVNELIKKLK